MSSFPLCPDDVVRLYMQPAVVALAEKIETDLIEFWDRHARLRPIAVPDVAIKQECPWRFPENATGREELGRHPFYESGYSPYTTCDYTQEDCRKRGMFGGIKK